MMSEQQFHLPDEWSALLNAMADESLTEEHERRLSDLLRTDAVFRREYVRFCQLLALLTWPSSTAPEPLQPIVLPPRSFAIGTVLRKRAVPLGIVSTALIVCVLWSVQRPSAQPEITEIVGQVEILRKDQPPIPLRTEDIRRTPWRFQRDDRIRVDRSSSAKLTLPDQSEIQIRPETELILAADSAAQLTLSYGNVLARVTPQKPGKALTFVTPQAEVRVVGTELELLALTGRTEVAVTEGRVNVTRPSDGQSRDVAGAEFLSVAESGDLTVISWTQPPDVWEEDFEQGLPPGWTGRIVRDGLPQNSRSAVQAVPQLPAQGRRMEISSPVADAGLFSWQPDSVLHVTFKVQPPAWLHIYLFARTYDGSQKLLTYGRVKPDLWQASHGEWRTATIPLSEFHLINFDQREPTLGRIPLRIVFSGPGDLTGVVIDHVRVDRSDSSVTESAVRAAEEDAK